MPSYKWDADRTIDLLQTVVATELVCVLRYRMHAISADGITSKSVAKEFAEHAESEHDHMLMAAERIDQPGGVPDLDPKGLASRAATETGNGDDLIQMNKDDMVSASTLIEQ